MKLSGFKSFVEPTTIKFPSNLMGIVGPNGCGKSNIIDAVRWVMGETSARQLRGESMSDVIFSGSSTRKPVGTATVELLFDNSDGRAGGEYADFGEISVRRQVSRDGQSAYWLNGTRCRKKDITNLFLGTGLGPRSYAIIEQGMISQIVEARPEELRAFLEEAAGISRYKERRRETENRIRHTRENLERLSDLREEVGKHIDKLKRQANAAERYKKLQARYRTDEARLMALRWREFKLRSESEEKDLREVENQLQSSLSDQRAAENELESLRQAQHGARDAVAKVQGELYEVASEIARIEQSIEHQREIRQRQQTEFGETEAQLNELKQHLVLDKAQVTENSELLARLKPELETARESEQQAQAQLESIDAQLESWQADWQAHQQSAADTSSESELLRQRIEHFDDRMSRAAERLRALDEQSGDGAVERLGEEKEALAQRIAGSEQNLTESRESIAARRARLTELRAHIEQRRNELESARAERHERQARIESLRVLNSDADQSEAVADWLAAQGLDSEARLLHQLNILEPEWNRAVECVLEDWLQAVQVDAVEAHLDGSLPALGLRLAAAGNTVVRSGSLADKVSGAGALTAALAQVHCAQNLDEAQRMLGKIAEQESVVTPEGIWLGHGWLRQPALADEASGFLQREQEIRALAEQINSDAGKVSDIEIQLSAARDEREGLESELSSAGAEFDRAQREHARLQGQFSSLESRLENLKREQQAAREELDQLTTRQSEDTAAVTAARSQMESALGRMEALSAKREPLQQKRRELDEARQRLRSELADSRSRREQLSLNLESSRAGLESLRHSIARMDNQVGQLQTRYLELSEALAEGDAPVAAQQKQRDQHLDQRLRIEERLRAARTELEALEANWREHDEIRQRSSVEVERIRTEQSERKLKLKETQLKAEALAGRVAELGADLETLLGELPEGVEAESYQQELESLEQKIRRLEPVNLAAIDEFETESERKEYLDRQHADLVEALETLEKAISRIDRDTRTRFRETFEQVNQNMEKLFPRLFGGGHGHLEMVGDDWLSAGVAILARPPGKRIARIHLLSGGEKALTAVAFVFSIFNLNPAPFCLLDEVDAPLDDANVGRFSEMVREMSEQVQFLIVTHNKVTMEVTHQMLGVTMREPGVSRLVSVDLDRAVALAGA